jgi:hypothetical protein
VRLGNKFKCGWTSTDKSMHSLSDSPWNKRKVERRLEINFESVNEYKLSITFWADRLRRQIGPSWLARWRFGCSFFAFFLRFVSISWHSTRSRVAKSTLANWRKKQRKQIKWQTKSNQKSKFDWFFQLFRHFTRRRTNRCVWTGQTCLKKERRASNQTGQMTHNKSI